MRRALKRLYADLAYLFGAVWLLGRSVRMSSEEIGAAVDRLEARRAARLDKL